jgi:hypothetical protein
MRSYQWDWVNEVAGADEYCFVTSTGPNAFGANSALGDGGCGDTGTGGARCGVDGFCD